MHTFLFCKRSTGLSTTPSSSVESTTYAAVQRSVDTLLPSSHSLISSCQQQHHLQNYMYTFVPITFKLLILYTCIHRSILKKSCINFYFEIRRHVPHFFCQFGPARVTAGLSSSSVSFFIFIFFLYLRAMRVLTGGTPSAVSSFSKTSSCFHSSRPLLSHRVSAGTSYVYPTD